jgi:hypothetical protein
MERGTASTKGVTVPWLPPNPPLQGTDASVAALPLAPAAERPYRWTDEADRWATSYP